MQSLTNRSGKPRTTFARTDIVTPSAGLFRIHEKSASRLEASEVVVEHDGIEISYTTPFRLGAEEWQLFLVICSLAGLDGKILNSESKGHQLNLWDNMLTAGYAAKGDSLHIRTTGYAILRELGKHGGGKDYKEIADGLKRLSSVFQHIRKGTKSASGSRLISYAFDETSGELGIGLSHHMAKAILGESAQHVRISLVEMRAMDNQAAVLLQAIFSARIRTGGTARYRLDTLAGHIYPQKTVSDAALRKRRQRVKEALLSLRNKTTWDISFDANGIATVHRVSKKQLEEWEKARELELIENNYNADEDADLDIL